MIHESFLQKHTTTDLWNFELLPLKAWCLRFLEMNGNVFKVFFLISHQEAAASFASFISYFYLPPAFPLSHALKFSQNSNLITTDKWWWQTLSSWTPSFLPLLPDSSTPYQPTLASSNSSLSWNSSLPSPQKTRTLSEESGTKRKFSSGFEPLQNATG